MKKLIIIFLFLFVGIVNGQNKKYAGTYSYGTIPDSGSTGIISIYPNSDTTLLFYLEVNRGAPSYNSGALVGQMVISSPGKADFTMVNKDAVINCSMIFSFVNDSLYIRTNNYANDCGYGHRVYSDGDFKRTSKKKPKFFIERNDEKTYFKELDWQKWWNGE